MKLWAEFSIASGQCELVGGKLSRFVMHDELEAFAEQRLHHQLERASVSGNRARDVSWRFGDDVEVFGADPVWCVHNLFILHLVRRSNEKAERDIDHGDAAARLSAGFGRAVAFVGLTEATANEGLSVA